MSLFEFVKEELIDEYSAREIIQPIRWQLVQVWRNSFERWNNWSEDDRRRLGETHTTQPNVLNAFAQTFAQDLFQHREDEGIIPCDGIPGVLFAFYLHEKVLIRFNALTSRHVVRYEATKPYKRKYLQQEPLPKLNNSASRLTAGYVLDASKTEIESVWISMQFGPDRIFHFQLDDENEGTVAMPAPASSPPLNPPSNTAMTKKLPR